VAAAASLARGGAPSRADLPAPAREPVSAPAGSLSESRSR
jgi:hypothetical protein